MAQHTKNAWSGIGYVNEASSATGNIAQYVGSQLTFRNAAIVCVALLLSQATLPGGAMPFCVPFIAALLLLDLSAIPALIGCALGLLIRWEPIGWINGWQLAAGALLWGVIRKGYDWKPWKVSLAAGAAMILPLPFLTQQMDMLIACLTGAIAASLLTPVCIRALLVSLMPQQPLTNDDKLCCLLIAAGLALGALPIAVGSASLGIALVAAFVMLIAWAAGAGLALPSAVLLGLVLMMAGRSFELLAMLAILGGIAGLFRGSTRLLSFIGGLLSCALIAFAQGGIDMLVMEIPAFTAGGLLFLFLPSRCIDTLCGILEPAQATDGGADTAVSAHVLSAYAEAMVGMAKALPKPDQTNDTQPVELLACRLCPGCEIQQTCWDERRQATMDLLDGILLSCTGDVTPLEVEEAARMSGCMRAAEVYGLSKGLIESRLRKEREDAKRLEARAWALEQLRGQARALLTLAERMGEDPHTTNLARTKLLAAMPALRGRPDALSVTSLGGKLHVWLDIHSNESQTKRLAQAISSALSLPMELLETHTKQDTLLFVERPALRLLVGHAGTPIAGEELSGDSTISERLDASCHLLALSDGMGSGREACRESRAALDLLLQAMRAGYGRSDALRTVNGLLVACRGDEMFATMDLCVLDLDTGEAAIDKMGACPSFLIRGGKCKRIGSDTLPLGILDAVKPRAIALRMQPGDMLLMVSDGVSDAFGEDESALLRALGGLATGERALSPQKFADTLLHRALERSGLVALDDMTVLVAKVEAQ